LLNCLSINGIKNRSELIKKKKLLDDYISLTKMSKRPERMAPPEVVS